MNIGVPKETFPGEKRVALVPKTCGQLIKLGHSVFLESGAGSLAGFSDEDYLASGAQVLPKRRDIFDCADLIAQVRGLGANLTRGAEDVQYLREKQMLIGLSEPLASPMAAEAYAYSGVTSFALELIPRTTKAQAMDVLSSQATLVGYYSVLQAATALPKIFPMLMTAAGTTKSARVLVLGAGVAGLQAIATARRLGAVVQGYDLRPAAMEQILSLGAKVVPVDLSSSEVKESGGYAGAVDDQIQQQQRNQLAKVVADSDVVICTAAVPGRRAPILISEEMVRSMRFGSVIIDLAAETGGNCELTQPGEICDADGVTIYGSLNLPSRLATNASEMFSQNLYNFLVHLVNNFTDDGELDDILQKTLLTRDYQVVHQTVRDLFGFGDYCVLAPTPMAANL